MSTMIEPWTPLLLSIVADILSVWILTGLCMLTRIPMLHSLGILIAFRTFIHPICLLRCGEIALMLQSRLMTLLHHFLLRSAMGLGLTLIRRLCLSCRTAQKHLLDAVTSLTRQNVLSIVFITYPVSGISLRVQCCERRWTEATGPEGASLQSGPTTARRPGSATASQHGATTPAMGTEGPAGTVSTMSMLKRIRMLAGVAMLISTGSLITLCTTIDGRMHTTNLTSITVYPCSFMPKTKVVIGNGATMGRPMSPLSNASSLFTARSSQELSLIHI